MHDQFVKYGKKEKAYEQFFWTFNRRYENKENTNLFFGIKIHRNSQNTTIFTQQG